MPSLNFNTGLKTLDINGDPDRVISFPPSDVFFLSRLYASFERIEEYYQGFQKELEEVQGTTGVLELGKEADTTVKNILDELFSDYTPGLSDIVFGKLAAVGVAEGTPLWAGFILGIISECDEYAVKQEKTKNPKLQKLLAKYGKRK